MKVTVPATREQIEAHRAEGRRRRGGVWDAKSHVWRGGKGYTFCRACGVPYWRTHGGACCGVSCQKEVYRLYMYRWRRGKRYRASYEAMKARARHPPPRATCIICSAEFQPYGKHVKACSPECSRRLKSLASRRWSQSPAGRDRARERRARNREETNQRAKEKYASLSPEARRERITEGMHYERQRAARQARAKAVLLGILKPDIQPEKPHE